MSDLISRARKALELPGPHEHSSMTVYAGHSAEHARTAKLVEALVECADVIVCTTSNEYGFSVSDYSNDAIAQLELVLEEMEKL